MRQATLVAMRNKNVTQTQIAESLKKGKAWVTKFLSGKARTIKPADMAALEKLLGIKYFSVEKASGDRSPLANKIAALVDLDPAFAKLAVALEQALAKRTDSMGVEFVPTKDLKMIGQEITRIVHAREDAKGAYQPKIAVEVIEYLRGYFAKRK